MVKKSDNTLINSPELTSRVERDGHYVPLGGTLWKQKTPPLQIPASNT